LILAFTRLIGRGGALLGEALLQILGLLLMIQKLFSVLHLVVVSLAAIYLSAPAVRAQDQLPPPWQGADVGATGAAGTSLYSSSVQSSYGNVVGGTFTVSGSGSDIFNGSDQFHFVSQRITGDTTIIARVTSVGNTNTWAKAGIMIRQSLSASSNFVDAIVTPSSVAQINYRNAATPNCGWVSGTGYTVTWLKLVRIAGNVTAYSAPDSSNTPGAWTQMGSPEPIAIGTAYVGMCVVSHSPGTLCAAAFDSVSLSNVQAVSADSLVDSIGVNTHFGWTGVYTNNYSTAKSLLVGLGVRHHRDGFNSHNADLAASGIKTLVVADCPPGTNQTSSYFTSTLIPQIKAVGAGSVVESLEGPNESNYYWSLLNETYYGLGWPTGPLWWLGDLDVALKADPATASLPLYSMTLWSGSQYAPGQLAPYADYGNFHPYPNQGNATCWAFDYDGIPHTATSSYIQCGQQPSNNIDEFNVAFDEQSPQTGTKPMVATETGYTTGTGWHSVSQVAFAKYIPRLVTEYFRRGIRRTYLYEFLDQGADQADPEQNFGLVYNSLTPKPAYTALKSLIGLLAEPGASFTPGSAAYSVSVSDPGYFYRTWYVHHMLLQKSNGTFYLLIYHEVADSATCDAGGANIATTARDLHPPAMPTSISLPNRSGNVTVYSYNTTTWQLTQSTLPIVSGAVTLNVPDTVTVIAFH